MKDDQLPDPKEASIRVACTPEQAMHVFHGHVKQGWTFYKCPNCGTIRGTYRPEKYGPPFSQCPNCKCAFNETWHADIDNEPEIREHGKEKKP